MSQSALPNIKLTLPHNRIKNSLAQLSDFFSEFQPVSPAFEHDKSVEQFFNVIKLISFIFSEKYL